MSSTKIKAVPCACGCGETLIPVDDDSRPRRYLVGHVNRGRQRRCPDHAKVKRALAGTTPKSATTPRAIAERTGIRTARVYSLLATLVQWGEAEAIGWGQYVVKTPRKRRC